MIRKHYFLILTLFASLQVSGQITVASRNLKEESALLVELANSSERTIIIRNRWEIMLDGSELTFYFVNATGDTIYKAPCVYSGTVVKRRFLMEPHIPVSFKYPFYIFNVDINKVCRIDLHHWISFYDPTSDEAVIYEKDESIPIGACKLQKPFIGKETEDRYKLPKINSKSQ